MNPNERTEAIACAVRETVATLGIEALKRLSWLPSQRKEPS